jgi:methylthioribose-1-phosphate isomerase
MTDHDAIRAIRWDAAGCLRLLDQRHLPGEVVYRDCARVDDVVAAIRGMVVRGAPAIGIAAAYGCVLAARHGELEAGMERLAQARPTAVNLRWALRRMAALGSRDEAELLAQARLIHDADIAANRAMGQYGARLIEPGRAVITHCNTGSLATGGFGTALGVIRQAWGEGRLTGVYAGETRPWLQGARLTAWELAADGIPVRLIADGAAASLMRGGGISWVIVGADRVAANGDVANKIGTYSLALAARSLGVGVMVVAPAATLDPEMPDGDAVRIETRDADELLSFAGHVVAPEGVDVWNPVFDITPASLVDVLVTEHGVVEQPDRDNLAALMQHQSRQELV